MSDLIERYGYERAVRELKAMDDRAIWMISSCLKYREEVRKECLEYRRQHNIYEEGDWIIYDDDLMVFAMWSKHHNEYAYIGYANADDGALEHRSAFRHATDEEIAQGFRDEL